MKVLLQPHKTRLRRVICVVVDLTVARRFVHEARRQANHLSLGVEKVELQLVQQNVCMVDLLRQDYVPSIRTSLFLSLSPLVVAHNYDDE